MTSKEQFSEFLQPDTIWEIFGINSQEDFIDKIITIDKFHENVPDSIKKDYKLVVRLQFYSYYAYPLIDEAFGKLTRIFEASIDLKIEELKIEKKGFETLDSKIKRLEKYSSNELHKQWLNSKEMRNLFAHHKAGRLMGFTLFKAFQHNVNMINSIFLKQEEILEKENYLKKIVANSKHLKKGLFIMEYNGNRYLIWSMIPYTSSINNGIEKSFWVFHPVYGDKHIKQISDFPEPFKLNLENLKINKKGLSALVIETNESITVTSTNINENIDKFNLHNKQMIEIDLSLKQKYWSILENDINKGVTEFIYNHTWE